MSAVVFIKQQFTIREVLKYAGLSANCFYFKKILIFLKTKA